MKRKISGEYEEHGNQAEEPGSPTHDELYDRHPGRPYLHVMILMRTEA